MKHWKISALVCVVVASLCMVLVGCQSQDYTPPEKEQTVPSSALGKNGTLRVGVNASSAPLAGQTSSSSRIVGIDVDVAAYIADQIGTKVEIVDVGNDPVSALDDGNVDIVLGVDSSESEADYWRSDTYLSTGVALFGPEGENEAPAIDSKPKVAAQASSRSSWRVTNLFGDESLVVQNDLKSAFEALAKGTVSYVAADAVIGTYVSYSNGYADHIVALLQTPSGYCAAVSKDNTDLQGAISAAIDKLNDGGMMEIIEKKWLGTDIDLENVTVLKSPNGDSSKSASSSASSEASGESSEASAETEADSAASADTQTAESTEAVVEATVVEVDQ